MVTSKYFETTGEPEAVLRVNIAGTWEAQEFAQFFTEFETLNEMANFGAVKVDGQSSLRGFIHYERSQPPRYWRDMQFEWEVQDGVADERLRYFLRAASGEHWPLRLKRMEFASPGFTDFAGIGKVVKEVRLFVTDIVDRFIAVPDRALAREEKRQSIVAKKIANAEKLMKLYDKTGLDPETRNDLIRRAIEVDRYIEDKIIEGRITSIESDPS
jgi:Glycosyltransferase (GlcNAc)